MIRVYRLAPAAHAADIWAGVGGLYRSGRWHLRGRPIVYTAGSVSLAQLEVLVHLDREDIPDLVLATADIPDDIGIRTLDAANLPADWRAHPPPRSTGEIGEEWLVGQATAVLCVPSVVSPEANYLLNPEHPSFAAIRSGEPVPFTMDTRLFDD